MQPDEGVEMGRTRTAVVAAMAGAVVGASGLGVAGAATGHTFRLGTHNRETATASLRSSHGAPLALHAPAGAPPLRVGSDVIVPHLDAAEVAGMGAAQLQPRLSGSCTGGIASVAASGRLACAAPVVAVRASTSWTVPPGVRTLVIQAVGGGGGGATPRGGKRAGGGGSGATVQAVATVHPGEVLDTVVGAGGAGGRGRQAAGPGATTMVFREGGSAAALVKAGGGHAGGTGRSKHRCGAGGGGGPTALRAAGVTLLGAADGRPGSCRAGGGAAGFPGAGGPPRSAHHGARGGEDGLVLLTLSG
jgi:hypothetical protein